MGMCLGCQGARDMVKLLNRGSFVWLQAESGHGVLEPGTAFDVCEGIDWRRPARSFSPRKSEKITRKREASVATRRTRSYPHPAG